jgi:hypothetical protein
LGCEVLLLQVVVPQGVLVRASAELTVTQALEIADMTLETSCRAIQWALNVPEVLLASAGAQAGLTTVPTAVVSTAIPCKLILASSWASSRACAMRYGLRGVSRP